MCGNTVPTEMSGSSRVWSNMQEKCNKKSLKICGSLSHKHDMLARMVGLRTRMGCILGRAEVDAVKVEMKDDEGRKSVEISSRIPAAARDRASRKQPRCDLCSSSRSPAGCKSCEHKDLVKLSSITLRNTCIPLTSFREFAVGENQLMQSILVIIPGRNVCGASASSHTVMKGLSLVEEEGD